MGEGRPVSDGRGQASILWEREDQYPRGESRPVSERKESRPVSYGRGQASIRGGGQARRLFGAASVLCLSQERSQRKISVVGLGVIYLILVLVLCIFKFL